MIATPATMLAGARRVVVKLGSALVAEAGRPAAARMAAVAGDVAGLRRQGASVILVSSGAIALGHDGLGGRPVRLADKQAAAAVGQGLLMAAWGAAFADHGLTVGQLLLSPDDTEVRARWLNARATIDALLARGVIPVVNENDSVATEEIRYGDNDRLAARTAGLARADLLVLLSDIDGLYTGDPRHDPSARHLPLVEALTPAVLAMAGGANAASGVGTGGMATKLAAAGIARAAGCATLIASGLAERPLAAVRDGARATLFPAPESPMAAYKGWIAGHLKPGGAIAVDAGAAAALRGGSSLLPAGITAVSGGFGKGECVCIEGPDGLRIGRGIAAYPAADLVRIKGSRSAATEALIGYRGPAAAIHRDDLVLEPA